MGVYKGKVRRKHLDPNEGKCKLGKESRACPNKKAKLDFS
jgi:hypothetical protein